MTFIYPYAIILKELTIPEMGSGEFFLIEWRYALVASASVSFAITSSSFVGII